MVARTSGIGTGTKTLVGMVLLTIGFIATLATVLGFFGSVWWAFDLAANLRFQLGVVLVVVAILYWIVVGKGAAIIFFAAGLLNLLLVIPLFAGSQAPAVGEDRVDIVTFNVKSEVTERQAIIEWLTTTDADIVVLQETTEEWVAALEDSLLDMEMIAVPDPDLLHGTTVLTTLDATAKTLPVGMYNESLVEISTSLGGRRITIFAVHAAPPSSKGDADGRDELLTEVGVLVASRSEPVAVVGDLAATRWSHAFRSLLSEGSMIDSQDGNGYQGTWPASDMSLIGPYVSIPVDHALTTAALTTTERRTGPKIGSDHLPLLVQLAEAGS